MSLLVSRKSFAAALAAVGAAVMIGVPMASAVVAVPTPQTPCNGQTVDRLGAFSWGAVTGAAQYEFQIADDPGFTTPALTGSDGQFKTANTRATLNFTLPNATYFWRVRAWSGGAVPDNTAWSAGCEFTLNWADRPGGVDPTTTTPGDGVQNHGTVVYPDPVKLNWDPVKGAQKYTVALSSSFDLSSEVAGFPITTSATVVTPPARLLPGQQYWWQVTPIDAQGNPGQPSDIQDFSWSWPSDQMTLSVSQPNALIGVEDPVFSWTPVPGAVGYQIQINPTTDFSSGNICCDGTVINATSYSPTTLLTSGNYFWRVRAQDASGNFGDWVMATSADTDPDLNNSPTAPCVHVTDNPVCFRDHYDTSGITNLTMADSTGADVWTPGYSTDTPIVTWAATPGAATYKVDVAEYNGSQCLYPPGNNGSYVSEVTAATSWTPLGSGPDNNLLQPGDTYCVQVTAQRHEDGSNVVVYGATTQLGGAGNPAFVFSGYPTGNPCTAPCNSALNIGAGDYVLPLATGNTSLPLFTWKPISGKGSYFVVVATDTSFQHVIDTAFTRVPAYAPRSSISVLNYPDTDTSYAWAVLPATGIDGTGAAATPTSPSSYPQTFTLHSLAPTLTAPADNATVNGPPTFQWAPVPGAYYYQLTVATSSSFSTSPTNTLVAGAPFTTQSTTFVGSNFATSQTLYWKVQAFDRSGNKLTFSPTRRFTESRPAPTFATVTNPTSGDGLPVFSWDPTPGAVAYDVELQTPAGGTTDFQSVATTAMAPTSLSGTGTFKWKVRAEFPTAGQNVFSPYSAWQSYTRTIHAPANPVTAPATAHQVVLSWDSKDGAKTYAVELASDSTFGGTVFDSFSTQNTTAAPYLTAGAYAEGGTIWWHVRMIDGDGNQGAWTAAQQLTLPLKMHLSVTGSTAKAQTTTVKVYARTATGKPIAGVSIKDSGCGLKAKTVKTGAGGAATFKIKPTKSGNIKFAATKPGAIASSILVAVY